MEKLIKLLTKYWTIISIVFTILSTLATGVFYVVHRIATAETTITNLNTWISDHEDTLTDHDKRISKLEEDERLREAGLCK
jgi:cell division protein FtsL